MDAFVKSVKVPKGELRKLAAEGMLTTDILISALQEQSQVVDDLYAKTKQQLGKHQQNLKLYDFICWSTGYSSWCKQIIS